MCFLSPYDVFFPPHQLVALYLTYISLRKPPKAIKTFSIYENWS